MNLSIVVPVYNIEHYMTPMFDTLLAQSEPHFEVIIVDDGSTDHTYNVIEKILSLHPELSCKVIRTENQGVSAARNRGLAEATGNYVLFLDGDDYISTDLVRTVHTYTQPSDPEIICWGYSHVTEDGVATLSYASAYSDITGSEALTHIFVNKSLRIWTGSIAYKRELLLLHELQYTERCVNGEDQEFIYKALSRATRVITLPDILSFYLQRNTSISNSYNVNKFDVVDVFKRVDAYFEAHPFENLDMISPYIRNRELIENYFFNLKTCLNETKGESIQKLLRDIDHTYPELNQEMYELIRRYRGNDRRLALYIRTFLISPLLYHRFISVEKSLSRFKRKEFRI
ncbi:glycosyltransferase involved in cell wall biosynthesis [Paenibacillus sp. PastF-3]|uniref:glycosyltransferase family 2 protein n=1 Tax=Paenibacillus sp. PastF-3 TaxID=2940626 RepID=UPI0024752692|nr:glycosyltransferase [Paenibacillus sp. PastF-3]MDH6370719.1 glycosyltransferase involved in cell wall biosynthesis [Paenibacillus sp. PastF-3]